MEEREEYEYSEELSLYRLFLTSCLEAGGETFRSGDLLTLSLVSYLLRFGEWERERSVEIVDTELEEQAETDRPRLAEYP